MTATEKFIKENLKKYGKAQIRIIEEGKKQIFLLIENKGVMVFRKLVTVPGGTTFMINKQGEELLPVFLETLEKDLNCYSKEGGAKRITENLFFKNFYFEGER